MRPRTIGILGGMGPQATVLLMSKLIASVAARDDADHIPLLVDQNPQIPSRIARLIDGTGEDPAPVLVAIARRLEAAGAAALAMPCNTAHHYAPIIADAVGIPFLDMVRLSTERAKDLAGGAAQIGILASPAVRRIVLFDERFAAAGLTAIYPSDEQALLAAIRTIKSEGATRGACEALRAASQALLKAGAPVQMIACTEFSLIADACAPQAQVFDTLDVLVSAIKEFSFAGIELKAKDPPIESTSGSGDVSV